MKIWLANLLVCFFLTVSLPAAGAQAVNIFDQRAHDLYNEIRCPVCSGQSISESDVPISISIREFVQARIAAGDSDSMIKQNLVDRYGQDILFEPVLVSTTLPLWLAPWIAVLFLVGGLWYQTGKSRDKSH